MAHILVVGNFPTNSITGHQVQTAGGYDEAIEILKKTDFDFIIIDAVIGATNGHAFLKRLSETKPVPTLMRHVGPSIPITKPDNTPGTWYFKISLKACFQFAESLELGEPDLDEAAFVTDWLTRNHPRSMQACA